MGFLKDERRCEQQAKVKEGIDFWKEVPFP